MGCAANPKIDDDDDDDHGYDIDDDDNKLQQQDCLLIEGAPPVNVLFSYACMTRCYSCDLYLDPMTLIHEHDLDILQTYPHTKNKVSRRDTHRQTLANALPHSRVIIITKITSLPRVILQEGRVAALSHTYDVKSPLVTMGRPKFAPKSTPYRGPIPKPHYLPHPWTRPTYDAKRHPDPISSRFSTMHWTDRQTDRQIVHGKV